MTTERLATAVESNCPLRIRRETRAGCCTWDTFIVGFAGAWPQWFDAEPTLDQWHAASRDWKAGNTGWEAAHNAQRRLKERTSPAAAEERAARGLARSLILVTKKGN